jgi:hypothetical protein
LLENQKQAAWFCFFEKPEGYPQGRCV